MARPLRPPSRRRRLSSPASRRSPTPAVRRPCSPPRPSNRRPRASCGCPRRTPCASRSGSTRTATSPTCVPTRSRCRTARSPPREARRATSTVPTTSRPNFVGMREGQERAGGPRGDPPGGRPVPDAAQVAGELRGESSFLYELIWKRTVASQMADARGSTAIVKLTGGDARWCRGRAGCGVHRQRHRHHLPVPRRIRGGPRRDGRQEAQGDRGGGASPPEARGHAARRDPRGGRRSRNPATSPATPRPPS